MSLHDDPVRVLVRAQDPAARKLAHQTLAKRAVARDDKALAAVHLKEALDLDPTDEVTAEELRKVTPQEKTLLQRWLGR